MKLFQKQKLKNLVKIDNNFMFYNINIYTTFSPVAEW